MKCIILAGGLGTRLRPITHSGPKQLIPIANKPMIHYPIEDLVSSGVKEIVIVVGYTPERINAVKEACGDGKRWGAKITYVEQDAPRGIAHGVWVCKDFVGDEPFVVYLGDNLLQGGCQHIIEEFRESDADCSILLSKVKNPAQFGVAMVDEKGRVTDVEEKPKTPKTDNVIVGVYLFTSVFFEVYKGLKPSWRGELEITDAIRKLVLSKQRKVISNFVRGWWKDTGKSEDILDANQLVLQTLPRLIEGNVHEDSKIVGNVQVAKGAVVNSGSFIRGPAIIGKGAIIGPNVYIGPSTSVGEGCRLTNCHIEASIIMEGCVISTEKHIIDSLIGKNVKILSSKGDLPEGQRYLVGENCEIRT